MQAVGKDRPVFVEGRMTTMTPAQRDERLRNILFNEGPFSRVKVDECSRDIVDGVNELLRRINAREGGNNG